MYEVGDFVFYGDMGVCRVENISEQSMRGGDEDQLYYTLSPLSEKCVVYTPVKNTKVFMRSVISKDEAQELIDRIPTIQARAYHSKAIKDLTRHYEASLKSYDCADLIELTMSIYAKKLEAQEQKRKLGSVDEKFMKRAEDLLFGELSVALGVEKDDVAEYIVAKMNAAQRQSEVCDHTQSLEKRA
ncbi:MAG: CarD family transcriptional regulator [Peptococcaceae bacterium]|nr:CarD family transcriptional regulator [Peptococcaceae bacterium]